MANPRRNDGIKRSLSESNISTGSNNLFDIERPTWKRAYPQEERLHRRTFTRGPSVDSYFGVGVGEGRAPLSPGARISVLIVVVGLCVIREMKCSYDASTHPWSIFDILHKGVPSTHVVGDRCWIWRSRGWRLLSPMTSFD